MAPGESNAVEVFAERNGEFARGFQQLADLADGHALSAAHGLAHVAAELLFDRNEQDIATGARVKRRAAEAAIWEEERQKAEKEAEEAAEKAKRSGKKLWGAARGGLAAAGVMSLSAFRLKQEVPMVNIADNKGRTAIMYAAGAGHNKMIEFLLERGAEIDATRAHATRILFAALH